MAISKAAFNAAHNVHNALGGLKQTTVEELASAFAGNCSDLLRNLVASELATTGRMPSTDNIEKVVWGLPPD